MFWVVAFKVYAIIKTVSGFSKLPWISAKSSKISLNQKTLKLLHFLSALKELVQINYKKICCYGTSININILLTHFLKISLFHFIVLVFFRTLWNKSGKQRFLVFMGDSKRKVPWNGLSCLIFSFLFIL